MVICVQLYQTNGNHWYSSVLTLLLFIFVYDGHSLKYTQLWLDLKLKYLKMQQANTEWLKYISPFGMASVWSFYFLFQFVSACSVFYDIPMYSLSDWQKYHMLEGPRLMGRTLSLYELHVKCSFVLWNPAREFFHIGIKLPSQYDIKEWTWETFF